MNNDAHAVFMIMPDGGRILLKVFVCPLRAERYKEKLSTAKPNISYEIEEVQLDEQFDRK